MVDKKKRPDYILSEQNAEKDKKKIDAMIENAKYTNAR